MDTSRAVERMEAFLSDQLATAGADGYVVGVSGGLDSAVATTLAVRAVGADAVTGLIMPGRPNDEANMADARMLCRERGIAFEELSIRPIVDAVGDQLPFDASRLTLGNVRARTRMVLAYAVANERDCLVLGTGNRSERLLGYFTKYGDAAVDVQPMLDLYKTEVAEVARAIDLDERFVEKTPTAALWEDQTDEGEIGADYATVDRVLRRLVDEGHPPERIAADTDIDAGTVHRLTEMWQSSSHKRALPPAPTLRE
ncbi:NAD+ synthase [Haloplanus aerogenes]|uniref:NH(3)-dependent NAD(+) synthetase n=1 Tax=Haloplanus aerogenes TaxID=660522 RepID=A0A3G8QZ97_9EURY|nr:NAD+ synthase [Haloplanus aerogenes]AZH26074.1 NAD+ synthase [Haloplanus aerogenes]RMB18476.1 NAD+ synthase [Haloplanus aerogenes]